MNATQRDTLGKIWAATIQGTHPTRGLSGLLDASEIQQRLACLKRDGLVARTIRRELDGTTTRGVCLTDKGRASITVVMCGGVFDIIHHGHIHMLEAAKALGDVLVVVVASDTTTKKTKKLIHHDANTRRRMVDAIGVVDVCLVGYDSNIFASVRMIRPDIITLGYDQVHQTSQIEAGCRKMGLDPKVVRLDSPVPDVASSNLKQDLSGT